jgi:hypothetical protein
MAVTRQSPRRNSRPSTDAPPPLVFAGEVHAHPDAPRPEPDAPRRPVAPRVVPPRVVPPAAKSADQLRVTRAKRPVPRQVPAPVAATPPAAVTAAPPSLAMAPRPAAPDTAPPWLLGTVRFAIIALLVGAAFLGLGVLFGRAVLGG